MSLLLEIYGYRIVSFTLTGGTAQQRAWATGVLQGAFNYQTEPNPNPPPAVRRKAVNGSDTWLDDLSRVFPLQHVPLALPTQAVMRNQATEPNSGQVYDFDQIVTYPTGPKVTIKWVPEPAAPGHSEFAATFFTAGVPGVSGPNWEIQVRDTMGTDAMDPQWQGQDFYQETLAHELGHVLTRVVMLRLGEDEAIAAFRELFDAPTAPWNTGPWEGRLEEAVAEFFKDMIWPTRRYDSRTNLKLPRAHFEAWKNVMVDQAVAAPEDVIQYETRSAWQYAFVGGSIHQHDGGLQPPSTFGAIPGDWYTYYAYNLNGDFSYDDHAGGFLIPVYGVATDSGKRSTATNFYVDWSTRSPGNAQVRATAPAARPARDHRHATLGARRRQPAAGARLRRLHRHRHRRLRRVVRLRLRRPAANGRRAGPHARPARPDRRRQRPRLPGQPARGHAGPRPGVALDRVHGGHLPGLHDGRKPDGPSSADERLGQGPLALRGRHRRAGAVVGRSALAVLRADSLRGNGLPCRSGLATPVGTHLLTPRFTSWCNRFPRRK
jgi:hypothetical protein